MLVKLVRSIEKDMSSISLKSSIMLVINFSQRLWNFTIHNSCCKFPRYVMRHILWSDKRYRAYHKEIEDDNTLTHLIYWTVLLTQTYRA